MTAAKVVEIPDPVTATPIREISRIVTLLYALGIDPLHLHVDGRTPFDERPNITVWVRYRTEFEELCYLLDVTPTERMARVHGQREWFAEADTPTRRLLVQCVSMVHHHDWQPREVVA